MSRKSWLATHLLESDNPAEGKIASWQILWRSQEVSFVLPTSEGVANPDLIGCLNSLEAVYLIVTDEIKPCDLPPICTHKHFLLPNSFQKFILRDILLLTTTKLDTLLKTI